jgi:CRP/FNR family transcriptional regulator
MQRASRNPSTALKKVPYFSNLSQFELDELAKSLVMRKFGANNIIFHLGDPGGLLYIISSGKVKISRSTPEGQEALLAILGPGDFFGELALLDDFPRSATAEAIEDAEMLTLHREEFLHFLEGNVVFMQQLLSTLSKRIRHLNSQISDIFFLDLPARLARNLLNLSEQHGKEVDNGVMIDISLTQTDMAEMSGATRVSINKALARFRKAGWVSTQGRHVIIHDKAGLRGLIQRSGG